MMTNPFPVPSSTPGRGIIELGSVPPLSSSLRQVAYQYPLKLVSPASHQASDNRSVQIVYLLTYGGGIVAGDGIDLDVLVDKDTRLVLLTQGSTKIFKSPRPEIISHQKTTVTIRPGGFLCYLPDPVQPFERSCFHQHQVYNILTDDDTSGSLCVLDWVCQGRTAMGENWDMWRYISRNDVWLRPTTTTDMQKRLLIRDNLVLTNDGTPESKGFARQMHGLGVCGTLILYGSQCEKLAAFFTQEFKQIPRIGGRQWDTDDEKPKVSDTEEQRARRQAQERDDGLLWTVTTLRNCTVIKFGAVEVEGGKRWLRTMLETDGSVIQMAGERALLCLR